MLRRRFTLLSAASLLLCVAAVGLRAWEHFACAGGAVLYVTEGGRGVSLDTGSVGVVAVGCHTGHPGRGLGGYVLRYGRGRWPGRPPAGAVLGGFYAARSEFPPATGAGPAGEPWAVGRVEVPTWFISLAAAAMPATWLRQRFVGRRHLKVNHCPACGYDLRASPGRCPECGAEPAGEA